jgi:hypothetical protein
MKYYTDHRSWSYYVNESVGMNGIHMDWVISPVMKLRIQQLSTGFLIG